MSIILKNITKLFQPNYSDLDAKLWVQKVILKKLINDPKDLRRQRAKLAPIKKVKK